MAQIVINEVSRSYTYNINDASFATVAMPLTASWGPAYEGTDEDGVAIGTSLDEMQWTHFPATQAGLESFVATYRGPAANYRLAKDYSYQIAMTLLTAGYDVLTCRLSPGAHAQGSYTIGSATLNVVAKYPGTFGNSLQTVLSKVKYYKNNAAKYYWNLVTYILDSSGVRTAVENLSFVFQPENSSFRYFFIVFSLISQVSSRGHPLSPKSHHTIPDFLSICRKQRPLRINSMKLTQISNGATFFSLS